MESDSLKKSQKANLGQNLENSSIDLIEDDLSFLQQLTTDWKLFWHGILGEDEAQIDDGAEPFDLKRLETLTLEQVKKITKTLSTDRKKLNQKIEEINSKIDLETEKLESLKLVGSSLDETVEQINRLNDIGQQLTNQLDKLNAQLKQFRKREDFFKKNN